MAETEDWRRYARIVNGEVVEVVLGDSSVGPVCPDGVEITWRYENDTFLPPLPQEPEVPATITRQQAAGQLLLSGMVSAQEAVAMAAMGTPPAFIDQIFASMPEVEGALARISFAKGEYQRANPLLLSVLTASGRTAAEIDDFFRAAATL